MGFYINIENISLETYGELLTATDLVPSREILKEHIDKYFALLKQQNIHHVGQLLKAVKTKQRVEKLSNESGVPLDYLSVLAREVKSYRSTPNKIKDFPGITDKIVRKLEKIGIKNARDLFDEVLTPHSRALLAKQTGIDKTELLRITKLVDLSRIRWVNHTFAYALYEAGYDTAEKVANADYQELYHVLKQLNKERNFYPAHIGLRDMNRCVEAAQGVSLDVEY